jgi:hypothetical protein
MGAKAIAVHCESWIEVGFMRCMRLKHLALFAHIEFGRPRPDRLIRQARSLAAFRGRVA